MKTGSLLGPAVVRVSETRWDCLACGGVGSAPVHRPECPEYQEPDEQPRRGGL